MPGANEQHLKTIWLALESHILGGLSWSCRHLVTYSPSLSVYAPHTLQLVLFVGYISNQHAFTVEQANLQDFYLPEPNLHFTEDHIELAHTGCHYDSIESITGERLLIPPADNTTEK